MAFCGHIAHGKLQSAMAFLQSLQNAKKSNPLHTSSLESTESYGVLRNPQEGIQNPKKGVQKGCGKAVSSQILKTQAFHSIT